MPKFLLVRPEICSDFIEGKCWKKANFDLEVDRPLEHLETKFEKICLLKHPKSLSLGKNSLEVVLVEDQTCKICEEPILQNGKKFGILENCDCTFCFDCI